MSDALDVLRFPLWGSRLIEASAGTGKTWTIAALYLRLVLGHVDKDADGSRDGSDIYGGAGKVTSSASGSGTFTGEGRSLVPSEILVMTFTKAATRELSDRIRSRLLEAARCFRGEIQPREGDTLLPGLMQAYPTGAARTAAAWRLSLAAESMDDAAIHTIDAWCQRMLREHAFDSGCLFDEELAANETAMQIEAAHDYWRQQVYPLRGDRLETALAVWEAADALTEDARKLLEKDLPTAAGEGSLDELIERVVVARGRAVAALKVGWSERAREMQGWLQTQLSLQPCPFDRRKLQARHLAAWCGELIAWAEGPGNDEPALTKSARFRLTTAGMQEAMAAGARVTLPAHFAAFDELMQALGCLQPVSVPLRLHAAARIKLRLAELKAQAGTFGFADMLTRLDRALDESVNGDNARRLRARILAQYPVALIDEFQDTSPVQSRIFDRLYGVQANDPKTALLLIGDPKQAIYAFRGADIYSYLDVRRSTAGRHYMLDTNHRSTATLVSAVNHVFAQAEARDGEGSFLYRQAADNPLPFAEVRAKGRADAFVTSQGASRALTFELDDTADSAEGHMKRFAERCAERIVTLLNDRTAGFQHPSDGFRRLRPADIAVLVRTGLEAKAVKRELHRRKVASVYLSDSESVFDSEEAKDLLHWLRAVASPRDARLARAAFATRTVGLSIAELARLAEDDEAFDARSDQLRNLHRVWQEQGVLTMLRRSLYLLTLPARWLGVDGASSREGAAGGERKLTNFLHLAELLQGASALLDGEQALIRWLSNQIEAHGFGDDEQIVRLESDADLVKLVTVHKAKGLEYPLVFLPFPYNFRPVQGGVSAVITLPDHSGARTLVLAPTAEQIAAADRERLREDLRLLYVALTRARYTLWVGLAALRTKVSPCAWHECAIGYLLGGDTPVDAPALRDRIAPILASCTAIELVPAAAPDQIGCTMLEPRDPPAPLRHLPDYAADFDRRWSIGSFSALVRALPAAGLWASSTAAVRDDEALQPLEGTEGEPTGRTATGTSGAIESPSNASPSHAPPSHVKPWHRFPRGAFAGNFLHDQLEWLGGEGFGLQASVEMQQQLQRRCERQGWGHRSEDVVNWLSRALATPLPPLGVALDGLVGHLPEMEFWLPSERLPSGGIDQLCRRFTLGGRDRPALPERDLRGMLMGFADLVFEHEGRYWVLDYKSNHLGMSDADYGKDSLEKAMAAHRYDVQAALYLLALHRLLQARLGTDYVPALHLGGAIYFFIRGIDGPERGCYVVPADLKLLDGLDALLRTPDEMSTPEEMSTPDECTSLRAGA